MKSLLHLAADANEALQILTRYGVRGFETSRLHMTAIDSKLELAVEIVNMNGMTLDRLTDQIVGRRYAGVLGFEHVTDEACRSLILARFRP